MKINLAINKTPCFNKNLFHKKKFFVYIKYYFARSVLLEVT